MIFDLTASPQVGACLYRIWQSPHRKPSNLLCEEVNPLFMITLFEQLLARLENEERGQTMAEYAVVLAVITIGVVTAIGLLAGDISA